MSINFINKNDKMLLDIATETVTIAARNILSHSGPMDIKFKSKNTNPVTNIDHSCEIIIRDFLRKTRPNDGLIGEEGSNLVSKNGLRWVFDPIDGTVNYIYQVPHWAISLSCEDFDGEQWKPRIGVVYDVNRNEMFSAVKNYGATLNGSSIFVNNITNLSKALLSAEYSYNRKKRLYQTKIMSNLLTEVQDIRSCGSSALDLCWVACGRWDGFYENELSVWDWSAGSLIVQEAGGLITQLNTGIVASPRLIHEKLYQLVK